MRIRLYTYAVVAQGLTWEQVQEAEAKANASPAGEHFRFYRHAFETESDAISRWSLLSMPRIYFDHFRDGADDSEWWIEIADQPRSEGPHTQYAAERSSR